METTAPASKRRGWDSNPRGLAPCRFSSAAVTLPGCAFPSRRVCFCQRLRAPTSLRVLVRPCPFSGLDGEPDGEHLRVHDTWSDPTTRYLKRSGRRRPGHTIRLFSRRNGLSETAVLWRGSEWTGSSAVATCVDASRSAPLAVVGVELPPLGCGGSHGEDAAVGNGMPLPDIAADTGLRPRRRVRLPGGSFYRVE